MRIFETFSKAEKRRKSGGQPDFYQHEQLPAAFRVQVVHIWFAAIGPFYDPPPLSYQPESNGLWIEIHNTVAREAGVFRLGTTTANDTPLMQCQEYLLNSKTKEALDIIHASFALIERFTPGFPHDPNRTLTAEDAMQELNHRFREHAIGYQYAAGELIDVSSAYLHAEAVRPSITLLHDLRFSGAEEEFLKAHEHYRQGRTKEAIVEALKAFESTMKAICDARKWPYASTATAKDLIGVVFTNSLIPAELQNQFTALRSVLESGVPTVRNKTSGHGQGSQPVNVPDYLAAYTLHVAAANIVLLVEAHKAKK